MVALGFSLTACQLQPGGGAGATHSPVLPPPSALTQQWPMPNLVGTGLQRAQDDVQRLTHNVVFFTTSHDVTGKGRHQIVDSDWKVCTQSVRPGATIRVGSKIDFGVVKVSENCP